MQAICGRPTCGARHDLPFVNQFRYPHTGAYAQGCRCGGPWVVVEDASDRPVQGRDKHLFIIETNPDSRNYGDAVEVHSGSGRRGVIAALDYAMKYEAMLRGYALPTVEYPADFYEREEMSC